MVIREVKEVKGFPIFPSSHLPIFPSSHLPIFPSDILAEREELATALPMVAPLNAFPFCSPQGPLQAHCAKSGKPLPLFFTPLSASKLATRYKKQKVSISRYLFASWSCGERGIRTVQPSSRYLLKKAQTKGRAINLNPIGSTPDKVSNASRPDAEQLPKATLFLWLCRVLAHRA